MAKSTLSPSLSTLTILFISINLLIPFTAVGATGSDDLMWFPNRGSQCRGSVAKCMGVDEFMMDTEINRRILATDNYISYQSLQRNTVPCSRRGQSYYNCQQSSQANPYNRGCSAIARCRS